MQEQKAITYERIVHSTTRGLYAGPLQRATDRVKRRDDTMYRTPTIHNVRLKRQALSLAEHLLQMAKELYKDKA